MTRPYAILAQVIFGITFASSLVTCNYDECMKLATGRLPLFGLGPIQNHTYFIIMGTPFGPDGGVIFRVPIDKFTCDSIEDCKLDLTEATVFRLAKRPRTEFLPSTGTFLFEAAGIDGVAKFSRTNGVFFWYPASAQFNTSVWLTFSGETLSSSYTIFADSAESNRFAYIANKGEDKWIHVGTFPRMTEMPEDGIDVGKIIINIGKLGQINKGNADGGFLWASHLVAFDNVAREVLIYRLGSLAKPVDPESTVDYRSFIYCGLSSDPTGVVPSGGPITVPGSNTRQGSFIAIVVCLLMLFLVGVAGIFYFTKKKKTKKTTTSRLRKSKVPLKSGTPTVKSAATSTGTKKSDKSILIEGKKGKLSTTSNGTSSSSKGPVVISVYSAVNSARLKETTATTADAKMKIKSKILLRQIHSEASHRLQV